MITMMGATGHTGKKITAALLKAGEKVRALGRSESKLAQLKSAGAEVLSGEATDAGFLSETFRGADAVYTPAFNEGTIKPREGRTPENTTPTLFEDFVPELARAYQAA